MAQLTLGPGYSSWLEYERQNISQTSGILSTNIHLPPRSVAIMDRLQEDLDEKNLYQFEPVGRRQSPAYSVVLSAARAVVACFNAHGLDSAVFGSLACKLYGNGREPRDVDILVMATSPSSQQLSDNNHEANTEMLKDLLRTSDPSHFELKQSVYSDAQYRVIWYNHVTEDGEEREQCKIDLVLPGTLHLPFVPKAAFEVIGGIPLLPFSIVLVQKLQGWDDHGKATQRHKRDRQQVDAADLRNLLKMEHHIAPLRIQQPWQDENLFDLEFQALTRKRVQDFCWRNPATVQEWQKLGLTD